MGHKPAPKPNQFAISVNNELRAYAARRSLSQRRLSEMTGIPQRTLGSMVWQNQKPLTMHYLTVICEALQVEPIDIIASAEREMRLLENAPESETQDGYRLAAKEDNETDVNEEDYPG